MDTDKKILEWAQKLEYKKIIPPEIKNICNNPSTAFLWEQLVTEVVPKQEVDHIRNNIILNRLKKSKKLQRYNVNQFHVKELDLWKKKQLVSKEIEVIEENIAEKEQRLDNLTKCVDVKCVEYQSAKLRVKENEEKLFLYERKSEQLRKEIVRSEESLVFFRNLTPVEEAQNNLEVAETLKKCADKIQRILDEERSEKHFHPADNIWLTPEKKQTMHSLFSDSRCRYAKNELSRNRLAGEVKCFKDDHLLKEISKILHENNTNTIWSVFLERIDQETWQLEGIMNRRKFNPPMRGNNMSAALTQLRAVHIRNELESMKYGAAIQRMNVILDRLQDEIYSKFEALNLPSASIDEMQDVFLLQRKEAGISAFCNCVHRQLELLQADLNIKTELNNCKIKCMGVQQELIEKIRSLTSKVNSFKKIYHAILLCQDDTTAVVRKLSQFTQDLKWTLALTKELHSKEIRVFLNFPLEYNRQININGSRIFARNTLRDLSYDLENVDSQTFQKIMNLVDSPHRSPEYLLYHLLQRKRKFKIQSELCLKSPEIQYEKCSLEELSSRESYVHESVEKLQILLKNTLQSMSKYSTLHLKEVTNLWIEMPFKEHLSRKVNFNGENVTHYQKLYDSYYDKL